MSTSPLRVLLLGADNGGVLTGVTTGTSIPIPMTGNETMLTLYLTSIGTTSGGTIAFEESDYAGNIDFPYSGTWSQITTAITASSFSGGAQFAYHTTAPAIYSYVRVRISATITGGGSIMAVLRAR